MSVSSDVKSILGSAWHVAADAFAAYLETLLTAPLALVNTLTATAAEINRATDVSGRLVTTTAATLTVTELLHDGKTIVMSKVDGQAHTLPAATGSGARFRFVVGLATTSVGYSIASAPTTDIFAGVAYGKDGDGDPANAWATASDTNKITLGGASLATGGAIGDFVEVEDIKAGVWAVIASLTQGGTEASPFSHV